MATPLEIFPKKPGGSDRDVESFLLHKKEVMGMEASPTEQDANLERLIQNDLDDLLTLYADDGTVGDYTEAFAAFDVEVDPNEILHLAPIDPEMKPLRPAQKREEVNNRLFGELRPDEAPETHVQRRLVTNTLSGNSFEIDPQSQKKRISGDTTRKSQRRRMVYNRFLEKMEDEKGDLRHLSEGERRHIRERVHREIAAHDRVLDLAEADIEAQDQVSGIVSEYEALEASNLSDQELAAAESDLVTQVNEVYETYEIGVAAVADKSQEIDEEIDEENPITDQETATVIEALNLTPTQKILGKTEHNDVIIEAATNVTCACDLRTGNLEWVKINIDGTEYIRRLPPDIHATPQNFRREVGIARLNGICAHREIPLGQPAQERMVEYFMEGTNSFNWDLYDQLEEDFKNFLHDLAPRREDTVGVLTSLGILDEQNKLGPAPVFEKVVAAWRSTGEDLDISKLIAEN